MPAYNFKQQFAADVESGKKRCTIRPRREKRPTRPGDRLALFCGMRTRQCRRLREATCTGVTPIDILPDGAVALNGERLSRSGAIVVAVTDGHECLEDFVAFFRDQYGLPTRDLELITW